MGYEKMLFQFEIILYSLQSQFILVKINETPCMNYVPKAMEKQEYFVLFILQYNLHSTILSCF